MSTASMAFILFHTSNHAFRAEKLLHEQAIDSRLIPAPRHLSSECGVCLRLEAEHLAMAIEILNAGKVEIASTHVAA